MFSRILLTTPSYLAFHIRIDKQADRFPVGKNIVCTSSYDDTVWLFCHFPKAFPLAWKNFLGLLKHGIRRYHEMPANMDRIRTNRTHPTPSSIPQLRLLCGTHRQCAEASMPHWSAPLPALRQASPASSQMRSLPIQNPAPFLLQTEPHYSELKNQRQNTGIKKSHPFLSLILTYGQLVAIIRKRNKLPIRRNVWI